jgi:hypothetical protein
LVRHHEARGRTIPPEFPLAELHRTNRIVGSVVEDHSTVQVLYRTGLDANAAEDNALDQLAIATVRRSAEGWRIWTTQRDPQLFGMENWYISIMLPDEEAERLQAIVGQVFAWLEGETPRVRASVQGYAGDARAPQSIRLEVIQADGSITRLELPYEVLTPLWEYLQPWMYLPDGDDAFQPS